MHNAHMNIARAAGQGGVHARKVVLDVGIFLIPRRLIADRGGIIALGGAAHGVPAQMRHAHGHAQRRLPVTLQLMAAEVEIPVGHAVQLAGHARIAELMHRGGRLLGGGELAMVAQHIDAGQLEAAVGTHGLAQSGGLRFERRLLHHVAGQHDAVFAAPAAHGVREGGGKALGDVIVIVIARDGDPALRQLPDQLGQFVQQILAIRGLIGFAQVVREGQRHVLLFAREAQRLLAGELRLVGEDGGHGLAEALAQRFLIALVGRGDELLDRLGVERIQIRLVVIPRGGRADLQIGVPHAILVRRAVLDALVMRQAAVLQRHAVLREQRSVLLTRADRLRGGHGALFALAVGGGREEQIARRIAPVARHQAARRAGGPTVLVVEPAEHMVLLGLVAAGTGQIHELVAQIGRGHARAGVHMEAAHAHLLEDVDLAQQLVLLQTAVPRPERRAAILAAGVFKQTLLQLLVLGMRIQHICQSFLTNYICSLQVFSLSRSIAQRACVLTGSGSWVSASSSGRRSFRFR